MADESDRETNSIRLSARIKPSSYERLEHFAIAKGWLLPSGKPNISRALNEALSRLDRLLQKASRRGQ